MTHTLRRHIGATGAAIMASVLLSACGQENQYVAPPPPKVSVALPLQRSFTPYLEATGNTAAVNSANLVARVQGYLQEISYQDGDEVKKGAPLFTIEPEPYRLKLEQAKASEQASDATSKQIEADYQRQLDLSNRQVSSKAALDKATADKAGADAKLRQAQLDAKQAEINYSYTKVTAPFDGIVTARQVSLGELVGGNSPTVLATIVQHDPVYVNFTINERDVLRIRENMAKRGVQAADLKGHVPVEIGLQNETGYPHAGTLDYVAPSVTASTGTLAARASFANKDHQLLPGFFVRVRIPAAPRDALLVPDVALGSDQSGRYLLVVDKDNMVVQRKVEIGQTVGELRVIESGLKPDERVVVAGALRAVPGQKVDPQVTTISTDSPK